MGVVKVTFNGRNKEIRRVQRKWAWSIKLAPPLVEEVVKKLSKDVTRETGVVNVVIIGIAKY